jgi:hypothetical protein
MSFCPFLSKYLNKYFPSVLHRIQRGFGEQTFTTMMVWATAHSLAARLRVSPPHAPIAIVARTT